MINTQKIKMRRRLQVKLSQYVEKLSKELTKPKKKFGKNRKKYLRNLLKLDKLVNFPIQAKS